LNVTSPNPILMSGYIADTNISTNGEALILSMLPLTTNFMRQPFYGNGSINFKQLRNTITDVLIVSAGNGSATSVYHNETPIAQECVLSWCVKAIQSTYSLGEYEEEVLETFENTTAGPWPWIATPYATEFDNGTDQFFLQDIMIDSGVSLSGRNITGYGTSNSSVGPVMWGFIDFFPSYTTTSNESAVPFMRYKTWSRNPPETRIIDFNPWLAPNNVTRHMERFATALTNVIRSAGSREMLEGAAYGKETYITVRWGWLSFPLLLLVLSSLFLVATIVKTPKGPGAGVWKNSTIPTLIYGLPKETQTQLNSSSTWNSTKSTKKVRIRLLPNMGWRVSGHSQLTASPRLPHPTVQPPRGWI
jgi:hypothetical protein